MKKLVGCAIVSICCAWSIASANEALGTYSIASDEFDLHAYYVSNSSSKVTFLAVFRSTDTQDLDPDTFDFQAACDAVLANPPEHPQIPKGNFDFRHGVIFVQEIQRRMFGLFSQNVSSFTEFDVQNGACLETRTPGEIYRPNPGFQP